MNLVAIILDLLANHGLGINLLRLHDIDCFKIQVGRVLITLKLCEIQVGQVELAHCVGAELRRLVLRQLETGAAPVDI
jgi:hypothetical protein